MPLRLKLLFMYLLRDLVFVFIVSSQKTATLEVTMKIPNKYNYAFDVRPVDRCPMNESSWKAAAARIGCSDTHGYHCVPDKFHSSLIEFCYNKTRILVAKGNCLELAANGILNHVKCHDFTGGCPNQYYFSNEIYKYPDCLSVAFHCFTSDVKCLHQKFKKQTEAKYSGSLQSYCEKEKIQFYFILALSFILLILLVPTCFCVFHFWRCGKNAKRKNMLGTGLQSQGYAIPQDLHVHGEVESELFFDDIYLSLLLRRHCRNGAFKNFNYLLQKRILEKNDKKLFRILTSRDKDGLTLLHCAAEGGCTDIFEALIQSTDQIRVDDTTYSGHTVLHIACKNKQYFMCRNLLQVDNYRTLLLGKESNQGWNAAHFTAKSGSIEILNLLESYGLNITSVTKNGLNALDIACINNHAELCEDLVRNKLNMLFKCDARGWAPIHFATMVGNNDIFDVLIEKNVQMANFRTKRQKNILHICCEFGNYSLCKKILKQYGEIIHEPDDEGWNALHYAAKGGNLKVFEEIEKTFEKNLFKATNDGKTVLHIACINNSTKICKHICKEKTYENIISDITTKGWTAAHYVAVEIKHDKSEEKLISILVKSGINLKAITDDGLTVLGVACEHLNKNLIKYLLKNHKELLGVNTDCLKAVARKSKDNDILSDIDNAIKKYERKGIDVTFSVPKKESLGLSPGDELASDVRNPNVRLLNL